MLAIFEGLFLQNVVVGITVFVFRCNHNIVLWCFGKLVLPLVIPKEVMIRVFC